MSIHSRKRSRRDEDSRSVLTFLVGTISRHRKILHAVKYQSLEECAGDQMNIVVDSNQIDGTRNGVIKTVDIIEKPTNSCRP